MTVRAHEVVRRHEAGVPEPVRRRRGVHYTPGPLADSLTSLALEALGRRPERVCDPSCGAGSFLVAAADALVRTGLGPAEALSRISGADVDPSAVSAARRALESWAAERGLGPEVLEAVELVVADTLLDPPRRWHRRFDLVIGNPPFLGQLRRSTARNAAVRDRVRRLYPEAGPYTDTGALFLAAALELTAQGGVVGLIQPQSILSARDSAGIRDRVCSDAELVSLWASDERHFDAEVDVCAPVLRRGGRRRREQVGIFWGPQTEPVGRSRRPEQGESWGRLLAPAVGIPVTAVEPSGLCVGDLASATAGFRDEFYALAGAACDPGEPGWDPDAPRLVTVGMIDPGRLTWGARSARLGGRAVSAPRLVGSRLDDTAQRWVGRRLRPKVMVATQTRILEAAPDPDGDCVPVTPTISVEPTGHVDLWHLLAALLAPPVSAAAAAEQLGSGLSLGAVRWSASAVAAVAVPADLHAWDRGAALARRLHGCAPGEHVAILDRLGRTMCEAHCVPADDRVFAWWSELARRACRAPVVQSP